MPTAISTVRRFESKWKAIAAALLISSCVSCGGGDGGSDPIVLTQLECQGGVSPAENTVALQCGGATSTTTGLVDVALGGPASGITSLRGVQFDVFYDPARVEYVSYSFSGSMTFDTQLVTVGLSNGQQGRLIVSLAQEGGDADFQVGPGSWPVMRLTFRRTPQASFSSAPLELENTAAFDASETIDFTSTLWLSYE